MTDTATTLARAYVGASGFSYPSWRPGFYPAGVRPGEFLRHYATRLNSVELNTTGYRLPSEGQFERWAAETPPGFRFSVKMPARGLRELGTFEERVRRLGDRLGPVRIVVQQARDEGWLAYVLGSVDQAIRYVFDFRHPTWDGVDVPRVNGLESPASFRYLRLREPPYDDEDLCACAARIRALLANGADVYCYFKHEDEPTAPRYAERLQELLQ